MGPDSGFDLRLLVTSAVTGGPVKVHCPNPDHDDRVSSCAVYHDHLYCYACGLHLGFQEAADALEPSLVGLTGRKRLETLGKLALATRVPQAKPADVAALAITAWQAHEALMTASTRKDDAYAWWQDRGFYSPAIRAYGFGATARAYTIPLVGRDGQFWGLKYRRRDDADQTVPKYWSPAGQRAGVYCPPLSRSSATVVLTEGELDAALLDSVGIPAISLTGGARMDPARLLEPWTRVLVVYDQDAAGREGAEAALDALGAKAAGLTWGLTWDPVWGKDFGDLRKNGHLGRVARYIVERWH